MHSRSPNIFIFPALLFVPFLFFALPFFAAGQSADEVRTKIDSRNAEIKKLEAEIAKYQEELKKTRKEITSISGAVNDLTVTSKKLDTDITLTQKKIETAELRIGKLNQEIGRKSTELERSQNGLSSIMRSLDEQENVTAIELLLAHEDLSQFWSQVDSLLMLGDSLDGHIDELRSISRELAKNKNLREEEKGSLQDFRTDLSDQKKVADYNKSLKTELLNETKSKESEYQKMLAERRARKEAFEADLAKLESQLVTILDPSKLPTQGSKALSWPLDTIIITQEFGDTAFSRSKAAPYNGKGHNGIDLGAPVGTLIHAAESGIVLGVGDTDITCRGASYGKWILIQHPNGLTTLYAHLSVIRAKKGSVVARGETIGFVGNTGYSTGPHLHFTVFASQGVQIRDLASKGCSGRIYTLPVASYNSYLNPLLYL